MARHAWVIGLALTLFATSSMAQSNPDPSAVTIVSVDQPFGLITLPNGNLLADLYQDGQLVTVDPINRQIIKTVNVEMEPISAINFKGLIIYASEHNNVVIGLNYNTSVRAWTTNFPNVNTLPAVCVAGDGSSAGFIVKANYASSQPQGYGAVQRFDPNTGTLGAQAFTNGVSPRGCALSSDNSLLAVADADTGDLIIFNAADLSTKATYAVGLDGDSTRPGPRNTLITGSYAFTANWCQGSVTRVNLTTGAKGSIDLGPGPSNNPPSTLCGGKSPGTPPKGSMPRRMVTDGSRLFVSLQATNAVAQIDIATFTLTRMIPLSSEPADLSLNAANTLLYVAEFGGNKITSHDVSR